MTGEANRVELTDEEVIEGAGYLAMPYDEYIRGLKDLPEEERQRRNRLLSGATSLSIAIALRDRESESPETGGAGLTGEGLLAWLGSGEE